MIVYSLVCESGHRFDSWFRDSAAFDGSAAQGLVACPFCGSVRVTKAIMAPAVLGLRTGSARPDQVETAEPSASETAPVAPLREVALLDDRSREVRNVMRRVRDKVIAEGHDVGPRFAAEARRIHEGVAPERQIFGQASVAEVRDLLEDGIPILPLPIVPDKLN